MSVGRALGMAVGVVGLGLGAVACGGGEEAPERPYAVTEEREACASSDPLRRPFFGDTHVHTTYSFDANVSGTRTTPRDAYRYARGEEIGLPPYDADGRPTRTTRLRRPLDFAAVTDHAEMLGEVRICTDPEAPGYDSDICWFVRTFRGMAFPVLGVRVILQKDRFEFCGADDRLCLEQAAVVWSEIRAAAEEAYDRSAACSFTTFLGYEWTATAGAGQNLHRNVIFRNANVPALPPSWVETPSAFDLWAELQRECIEETPGCDALTIPHNSNLSGPGLMFESARLRNFDDAGLAVDAEEARLRQRWEPIIEIMQHKGDSECLLGGDTTDEACGFEKLPYNSFAGPPSLRNIVPTPPGLSREPDRRAMVREGLKKGLALEAELGVNPLKFGIVASTDTHMSAPGGAMEDRPFGHAGAFLTGASGPSLPDRPEYNPGGLAVLWAEENTRDALFAAMQRREAYGTSGTRPVVRFFGGWDYPEDLCGQADFVERGYAGGVPMGGDLPERPGGDRAPTFAVRALQDPGTADAPGTPLQRVQIVKGWLDGDGLHERVVDVAGGPNGASVDLATCRPRGEGAAELCTVWRDPDFDPSQRAFYYARVLENPTCRWSQHVCVANGVDCADPASVPPGLAPCCAPDHRPTIQERAWTSPIWYAP